MFIYNINKYKVYNIFMYSINIIHVYTHVHLCMYTSVKHISDCRCVLLKAMSDTLSLTHHP